MTKEDKIIELLTEIRDSLKKPDRKPVKRFIPPTLAEISAYCNESGNGINPNNFYNFYSSKGWMVGKNKMKDWKAAVRTWEKREKDKINVQNKQDNRSRAQRVSDKLDEIARKDIEQNGFTSELD